MSIQQGLCSSLAKKQLKTAFLFNQVNYFICLNILFEMDAAKGAWQDVSHVLGKLTKSTGK